MRFLTIVVLLAPALAAPLSGFLSNPVLQWSVTSLLHHKKAARLAAGPGNQSMLGGLNGQLPPLSSHDERRRTKALNGPQSCERAVQRTVSSSHPPKQRTVTKCALVGIFRQLDIDTVAIGKSVSTIKDGDAESALKVKTASDTLAKDIQASLKMVQQMPKLTISQSLAILPPFKFFIPDTQQTLAMLTSKKPMLDKMGVSSLVVDSLKQQKDLGGQLNAAIAERLLTIARPIGAQKYGQIDAALGQALQIWAAPGGSSAVPA